MLFLQSYNLYSACFCVAGYSLTLQGFDEFMNLVIDDAVEINLKKQTKRTLGQILLKGDNITLVSAVPE